jgi:serine/threonine-protein kinase HipA
MNICPVTYLPCGKEKYSQKAAELFFCDRLHDFPFTQSQQLELALESADKLSIQGVQPKLSATFDQKAGTFRPVNINGTYILKLQHKTFLEVPQNEDLTMRLAKLAGIDVPMHGLIYSKDGTLLYFIQRFDRERKVKVKQLGDLTKKQKNVLRKICLEDFSQLSGLSRDTKYDFSMEKIVPIVEKYCTFPVAEKMKLFRLTLFSFLVGNEDLHVKNFSLIRSEDLIQFSPAYDLVNTTIITKSKEELALPLRGKKSNFTKDDFISYYGRERLGLPISILDQIFFDIQVQIPNWKNLIKMSFLSDEKKIAYLALL